MIKTTKALSALAALAAGAALAQSGSKPDPLDSTARVPPVVYRSGLSEYRPYRDPAIADWRETNAEVGKLGGHGGHIRPALSGETPKPSGAAATAPSTRPSHPAHGGTR